MALLTNSNNIYKTNQANVLFGAGTGKYKPEEIKAWINTPGRTDSDVLGKALADGVSISEIASAMKGNPNFTAANMEKYVAGKGITRELATPGESMSIKAKAPTPVNASPIIVGTEDTMAGQMKDLLENPDNPLNVQAQNYGKQFANRRGLLNSSIAASATQDAMMKNAQPIASQDASTNYDSKKTNTGNKLTADMFNTDTSSRVDMFNAGTAKDMAINTQNRNVDMAINTQNRDMDWAINSQNRDADMAINTQNRDMDLQIANMDADNKMAIAQVQAAANDSGIMGDVGKSYMNLYQQTASDPNIEPDVKLKIFDALKSQFEQVTGLLPSFQQAGKNISLGASATDTAAAAGEASVPGADSVAAATEKTAAAVAAAAAEGRGGEVPEIKSAIGQINVLGYKPEPYTLAGVAAYERATGTKVDRSLVVPEQLREDFNYQSQLGFTNFYTSADGSPKVRNIGAYNFPALLEAIGVKDTRDLQTLFIPVHPPGTMRTDGPMFYVWNTDALIKAQAAQAAK